MTRLALERTRSTASHFCFPATIRSFFQGPSASSTSATACCRPMKVRPDLKLFWLALFAAALPRPAGAAQMEASGYLKEFYRRGRSPLDHRLYWLSLTRARLTLENASDLVFDSRLKLHLDYDHELRTGTFLKSPEFKTFGLGEPPGFWDLERTVSARGGRRYRHLLYRAWAGLDRGADQIRAGRQRIAWG